ncbi:Uncharacterized protein ehr_00473 [Ehrlichia minasensis]|nr:Uncharacterized protein ehr_00473 [Ehrlichia minasensis]
MLVFLAVISVIGGAAAAVLLRLIANADQNEKNENEEQKDTDEEKCVQESGKGDHSKGKTHDGNTTPENVSSGKRKKRSRTSKKSAQEIGKTGQDKQNSADTSSGENANGEKDEGKLSGKAQVVIPKKNVQEQSENSQDRKAQNGSATSGENVRSSGKRKKLGRSGQSVQEIGKADQAKQDGTNVVSSKNVKKNKSGLKERDVQSKDERHSTETTSSEGVKSEEESKKGLEQKAQAADDKFYRDVQCEDKKHDAESDGDLTHQAGSSDIPIQSASEHTDTLAQRKKSDQNIGKDVVGSGDTPQASSSLDQYLALGARPKERSTKSTKGKIPKPTSKPAVEFYDWSSRHYGEEDPLLVQSAKESVSVVKSTAGGEDVSTLLGAAKVQQKPSKSTTSTGLSLVVESQDTHAEQPTNLEEISLGTQQVTILGSIGQRISDPIGNTVAASSVVQKVCDKDIQKGESKETVGDSRSQGFNQHLKSLKVSKVSVRDSKNKQSVIDFNQNVLPSALDILKYAGKKPLRRQAALNFKFCALKMMHLKYCCDMSKKIFLMQKGKIYTCNRVLSFLRLNIPNYRMCIFVLKLFYVLNCTEIISQPTFCKSLVYNAYFFRRPSILCSCISDLLVTMQHGYPSMDAIRGVLYRCHVRVLSQNNTSTLHGGAFFSELLQVLVCLASIRLSVPDCLAEELDFTIVGCSMLLGSLYSNYKHIAGLEINLTKESGIGALLDCMGSTGPCRGKLGTICYYMLCNMLYMYNASYNTDVLMCGVCLPARLVKQCSQYFYSKVENSVGNGTMGFHVIIEDLSMLICSMLDRFNLAAFEREIQAYADLYDMVIHNSNVMENQGLER